MKYSNEDFIRLMTEIEDQGGEHLDEICGGQEYTFQVKKGDKIEERTAFQPGCESEALFNVKYDAYESVVVPEPILEPDPTRNGQSKRQKTRPDPNDPTGKSREGLTRTTLRHGPSLQGRDRFHTVRVCANDDNVGAWPRFAHVIKDKA
jgi:hypothetical protein